MRYCRFLGWCPVLSASRNSQETAIPKGSINPIAGSVWRSELEGFSCYCIKRIDGLLTREDSKWFRHEPSSPGLRKYDMRQNTVRSLGSSIRKGLISNAIDGIDGMYLSYRI